MLTGPSGCPGRSSAWCLTRAWTERWRPRYVVGGLVVVPCRPAPEGHSVRWGAACGRSAAAADEECCPPSAERDLTSENCGGRDRV
jgi:hypothetical protein